MAPPLSGRVSIGARPPPAASTRTRPPTPRGRCGILRAARTHTHTPRPPDVTARPHLGGIRAGLFTIFGPTLSSRAALPPSPRAGALVARGCPAGGADAARAQGTGAVAGRPTGWQQVAQAGPQPTPASRPAGRGNPPPRRPGTARELQLAARESHQPQAAYTGSFAIVLRLLDDSNYRDVLLSGTVLDNRYC